MKKTNYSEKKRKSVLSSTVKGLRFFTLLVNQKKKKKKPATVSCMLAKDTRILGKDKRLNSGTETSINFMLAWVPFAPQVPWGQ